MSKLVKGDSVKVLAGKDKGRIGKIGKVYPKEKKVLVENANQYKRHLKKRTQNEESQIVTITKPLPFASVELICPKCNRLTRVEFKLEKGKKVRVCKKCKKEIN